MSVKVNALPVESNPALTDSTINDSANIVTKRTTWQKIFDLFVTGGIAGSFTVQAGIVAAGATQGTATSLTKTRNRVDTVAAGTGVVEDATNPVTRTVQNNAANDLLWYPNGTNQFYITGGGGLQGAGVPISIAPGNSAAYVRYTNGVLTLQG